jgi:hypothetical protein
MTESKLPFPREFAWTGIGSDQVGTISSVDEYTARATHCDAAGSAAGRVRVDLTPNDVTAPVPSIYLAFTPEQWATIFAVVASVAPRPVWSMTEELKR